MIDQKHLTIDFKIHESYIQETTLETILIISNHIIMRLNMINNLYYPYVEKFILPEYIFNCVISNYNHIKYGFDDNGKRNILLNYTELFIGEKLDFIEIEYENTFLRENKLRKIFNQNYIDIPNKISIGKNLKKLLISL